MKTVNLGSAYTHRITLRLTEEQFDFLTDMSKLLGVSPSDYLRMSINSSMCLIEENLNFQVRAVGTDANVKTNIDDIL